jgi:WD40 repeat protein
MASRPDFIELTPNQTPSDQNDDNSNDPCVSSISVSSNRIIAATQISGTVALFDAQEVLKGGKPKPFSVWTAHQDSLNSCRFLSRVGNGTFLATCSDDSSIRIFDCQNVSNGPVALYPAPAEVNCLCESTDGTKLYAGCDDGSVICYTYGSFTDPTKLAESSNNNNANNNNNQQQLSPCPNAAPPASFDRFIVGEGAVNDLIVVNLPYGDILFTATDEGCVRAWRTQPGQKAPNERSFPGPSNSEIEAKLREAQQEGDNNNNNNNNNDDDEGALARQMIIEALGDPTAADRLLCSFDMLKGGQINHLASTTIGNNEPAVLIATNKYVFAVPFNVSIGELAEEPSLLFQGANDFIRGVHPIIDDNKSENSNNNNKTEVFWTVADDGSVCVFKRNVENVQEPVDALAKFQAENVNIMSSAVLKLEDGKNIALVTGSLLGSVKLWKMI